MRGSKRCALLQSVSSRKRALTCESDGPEGVEAVEGLFCGGQARYAPHAALARAGCGMQG